MIPIFFPFTHISPRDLSAFDLFFNDLRYLFIPSEIRSAIGPGICSVVSAGGAAGIENKTDETETETKTEIDLRLNQLSVDKTLWERVVPMAREYKEWAGLHSHRPGDLKALLRESPYMTCDTGVAAIRADITKKAFSRPETVYKEDPLADALLFLLLAQESDMAVQNINKDLQRLGRAQDEMVNILKGESSLPETIISGESDDPGSRMTEKRLRSWALIFEEICQGLDTSKMPVFVTPSPAVFDFISSNAQKRRKILDITDFKVHERKYKVRPRWQADFENALKGAINGDTQLQELLEKSEKTGAPCAEFSLSLVTGGVIDVMFPFRQGKGRMDVWIRRHGGSVPVCLIRTRG